VSAIAAATIVAIVPKVGVGCHNEAHVRVGSHVLQVNSHSSPLVLPLVTLFLSFLTPPPYQPAYCLTLHLSSARAGNSASCMFSPYPLSPRFVFSGPAPPVW
jgi:hypothetical protein